MNFLNDIKVWTENLPAPSIPAKFKQQLAKIGKEYRLVWGQDFKEARTWNRYQNDWFPKYWFRTVRKSFPVESVNPANGLSLVEHKTEYRMIGVPRFFIEANIPAAVAYVSGTQAGVDSDGEAFGAAHTNPEGEWMPLFEICTHNGFCCEYAAAMDTQCHGNFRLPADDTLAMVQAHKRALEALPHFDPFQPVSEDARLAAHKQALDIERERRAKLDAEMKYATENFLNTHIHRLDEDPSSLKHGKYHFT